MPAVTLREIALEAGVSVATVSRVFSAHPKISAQTRERVMTVAEALGYRSPPAQTAPPRTASHLVGLLVADLATPLLARSAAVAARLLRQQGRLAALMDSGNDLQQEIAAVEHFRSLPIAGLLVAPAAVTCQHLAALRAEGVPVVSFGVAVPGLDSVALDAHAAGRLAGEHLLAQGHRRIAFVDPADPGSADCWDGLNAICGEAGLSLRPEWRIRSGGKSDACGEGAAQRLMALRDRPTAVLTPSEEVAASLMAGLGRNGARVPEDCAVVTLGDGPLARLATPSLTAVSFPDEEIGRLACELLFRRLQSPDPGRIEHVLLQPSLVARQSTAFRRL